MRGEAGRTSGPAKRRSRCSVHYGCSARQERTLPRSHARPVRCWRSSHWLREVSLEAGLPTYCGATVAKTRPRQASDRRCTNCATSPPPGLITVNRDTVAIGPKRLWTDVGEVEAATEPAALADALEEVEWPPLGDLDDVTPELDEWLRSERVRLSTVLLQKGIKSADYAMVTGEPMWRAGLRTRSSASTRSTNGLHKPGRAPTSRSVIGRRHIDGSSG